MDIQNAQEYFNHRSIIQYSIKIDFVMQKECSFSEENQIKIKNKNPKIEITKNIFQNLVFGRLKDAHYLVTSNIRRMKHTKS